MRELPEIALADSKFSPIFPEKGREWLALTELIRQIGEQDFIRAQQSISSVALKNLPGNELLMTSEHLEKVVRLDKSINELNAQKDEIERQQRTSYIQTHQIGNIELKKIEEKIAKLQGEREHFAGEAYRLIIQIIISRSKPVVHSNIFYSYQVLKDVAKLNGKDLPTLTPSSTPQAPLWYAYLSSGIHYLPELKSKLKSLI